MMAQVLSRLDRGPAKREEGSVYFPDSGSGPGAQREKPGKAGVGHPAALRPGLQAWGGAAAWLTVPSSLPGVISAASRSWVWEHHGLGSCAWGLETASVGFHASLKPLFVSGDTGGVPQGLISIHYRSNTCNALSFPATCFCLHCIRNSFQEFWPVDGVFLPFLVQISLLPIRS